MFVDLGRLTRGPLERDARVEHVLGKRGDFGDRHAAEVHRHRPRCHLVVGYIAADITGDERTDFVFGQLAAIALFRDEADYVHCGYFPKSMETIPDTMASSLSRAVSAVAMTSWPLVVTCLSGEQMLVIVERPSTRKPAWTAMIASGTVDMPTASASKYRSMRISARVS